MSDGSNIPRKKSGRKNDVAAGLRFIEELSWLLSSHSNLDFRVLQNIRNQIVHTPDLFQKFAPKNPNIVYLVGTLPALFMNEKIFPANEDIAEFSELALGISIPRWQKKAKFELVGHIVCHAVNLDDQQVESLTIALNRLVDGDTYAIKLIQSRKKQGLNWNEAIQDLLKR